MECFTMCWMFDHRWLCKINNPFYEFLLIIPIAINLAAIVGILLERGNVMLEVGEIFITLLALYGLLTLLTLYMLLRTTVATQQQIEGITENLEAIRQFTHNFEIRRSIWSWAGFLVVLVCASQMVVNKIYIDQNITNYNCLTNIIRLWIDIVCWGYIALIMIIFLVGKLLFLLISWKYPEFYLNYREVL